MTYRTARNRIAVGALGVAGLVALASMGTPSAEGAGVRAAACKPRHPGITTIKQGELQVVGVAYPPAIYEKKGVPYGTDGDLIKAFAAIECLKLKFTTVPGAGAVASITSRRADVLVGDWWRVKTRRNVVGMTAPIYIDPMVIMSRNGYRSLDELKGKRVGDLQGTTWNAPLKKIIGSGYKVYQTQDQLNQDVTNGRLDAGTTTFLNFGPLQKAGKMKGVKAYKPKADSRVDSTRFPGQSAFQYTKDATGLGKALDASLALMRKNGTMARVMQRYGLPTSLLNTGKPYYV